MNNLFMKPLKLTRQRHLSRVEHSPKASLELEHAHSSPDFPAVPRGHVQSPRKVHSEAASASDTKLSAKRNETRCDDAPCLDQPQTGAQVTSPLNSGDMPPLGRDPRRPSCGAPPRVAAPPTKTLAKPERGNKCCNMPKKQKSFSSLDMYADDPLARQIREIHNDTRKSARVIRDSRARLLEIQKKGTLTEADVKELGERNELLLREMERFDRLTRNIQKLVGIEAAAFKKPKDEQAPFKAEYIPGSLYEPPMHHQMKMDHPSVLLGGDRSFNPPTRSKSEIDLTRKLTECYDMQEKLVADNADLEVKRYILYKELMTKDQNLETCRAQVKRLQGELKLISKENSLLQDKLTSRGQEGGDATAVKHDLTQPDNKEKEQEVKEQEALVKQLEHYKSSTVEIENLVSELEFEVRNLKVEMASIKPPGAACRGGSGQNTCFEQPSGKPPVPPLTRACKVCPPCPAVCNPNAPPTPAEREVARLTIQLKQTEENFKTKVTEWTQEYFAMSATIHYNQNAEQSSCSQCAVLRADLVKKKEELERERCLHREVQNKLRELEMKFEGLTMQTNMNLGSKEQAMENEIHVRTLKQCYREAREEIDELRLLLTEQGEQLQDYRTKYMQAQQLVEEQRRQMDMMDMDNTRISEQINLEIQRVKLKFQEKLQELAPIPDLLKATQMRLKDAQQAQAIAEHNAEQLARELNCAREKVHALLHNSLKGPEKPPERGDEKQIAMLSSRITQLTDANQTLKTEIERLKSNVIRMEECVLANEKRLQEKMHECAALGGDLDRARDEAARALQRANERLETMRKCMQTTIAELERQLASSRAQVRTAEKDRDEVQARMQCQLMRLNDNFEQAQLRILGLKTQVQALRHKASNTDTGEGDAEPQQCACVSFFET